MHSIGRYRLVRRIGAGSFATFGLAMMMTWTCQWLSKCSPTTGPVTGMSGVASWQRAGCRPQSTPAERPATGRRAADDLRTDGRSSHPKPGTGQKRDGPSVASGGPTEGRRDYRGGAAGTRSVILPTTLSSHAGLRASQTVPLPGRFAGIPALNATHRDLSGEFVSDRQPDYPCV